MIVDIKDSYQFIKYREYKVMVWDDNLAAKIIEAVGTLPLEVCVKKNYQRMQNQTFQKKL